jgi:hypothetical protein
MKRTIGILFLIAAALPAQIDDPRERIKDITRRVAEEMAEIDKLLLRRDPARAAERIEEATKQMQQLLEQTRGSQDRVIQGIDELMQQIRDMQQQQSGGSGESDPSQRPQPGERQGDRPRPSQREQTETPDMVRQQREEQQRQGQPQPSGQPQGPEESKDKGQNARAAQQPEGATEQVQRAGDSENWGNLPGYLHFLQGRGATPEVPERYRRQVEAFLRQAAKGDRGRR